MKSLLNLKYQLATIAIILCALSVNSQNNTDANLSSYEQTLVLQPKNFFVSPNVRDLPVCDDLTTFDGKFVPRDGVNEGHEMSAKRKRKLAHLQSAGESDIQMDPLAQGNIDPLHKTSTRAPIVNFEAIGINVSPPDPSMAVGPNHIVTMENGLWAVYDKNGVMAPGFPKTLDDPLSGPNHSDNAGDPVVMYDREADRWFLSQFQLSGNPAQSDNVFLVGISTTPDPTGSYNIYEYELNAGNDYPHYGVWGDSYVTAGNFTGAQKVYTFNRAKMLAGDATAEIVGFSPANLQGAGFTAPIPVHSEGAGDATGPIKIVYYQDNAFAGVATDHVGLWNITMDWSNATGTITDKIEIPTTAFDAIIAGTGGDGFANLQQPGTTQRLDAIVGAVMNMSHWYKFPTHESILLNWVVEIGNGTKISGIRWVELRSTNAGATWSVFQEGTFTDPTGNESVFMGCISMDAQGNIGLGYTKTGNTTFPSLFYTGRMDGDPLGTMTVAEDLVIEGTTATTNSRYGDYGQGVRDPVDDLTFWVTSEYSGAPDKKVRVYSFKLAADVNLEINCPNNVTLQCGSDTTPASTGTASATSDCDPNPVVTFTDEIENTCGNTQIITRTWQAVDSCDSPIVTCIQTITLLDTNPPTVECPEDIMVFNDPNECTAIVNYNITASDTCGNVSITQITGLASGSAFPIGDTINEFEIEDDCGNVTECSFMVTVQNSVLPEAICQNITVALDANGMATITATDVNGGSGTICESENATINIDSFDCSNIGDNDVVLTVVDNEGNEDSCTAVVTVVDNTAPVIDCSDITLPLDNDGMAILTEEMIDELISENCEVDTIITTNTSFDCSMVGEQTVTITVTDVNGNGNSCDITVTVVDNILPTALCQDITVELDADGQATIEISDINNNSSDNCGDVTVEINIDTFNCDNLGENEVVLTVTDVNNNVSECGSNVTVIDNISPTALCQNIEVEINEDGDPINITPAMIDNGSTDNCAIATYTVDITVLDCTNLGENEVQLTVIDSSGNEASCTAIVTVNPPSVSPEASCQDVTIVLDENGMATLLPQSISTNDAFNLCGYVLTLDIDTFTCEDAGTVVPVTLTVTDAEGLSDTCEAEVTVIDNLAPTIICPEETIILAELTPYALPDYVEDGTVVITDNCFDQLIITQEPEAGTLVEEGETEITITVTDPSGNMAGCVFEIFVDPSLGNSSSEILNTLKLYPNPSIDSFSFSKASDLMIQDVTIFDIMGRKIKSYSISEIQENKFYVYDLANASYFVIVKTNLGLQNVQLIKQ